MDIVSKWEVQKMKKNGILNPQLNRIISEMGHGDMLIIADAGLPIPKGVERIDLALKCGSPSFAEVLKAVLIEFKVEESYVAKEIKEKNPQALNLIASLIKEIQFITHTELKDLSKQSRAIIRTGECSPYSNIILTSGVTF
jgi:D-ribose pyranase